MRQWNNHNIAGGGGGGGGGGRAPSPQHLVFTKTFHLLEHGKEKWALWALIRLADGPLGLSIRKSSLLTTKSPTANPVRER